MGNRIECCFDDKKSLKLEEKLVYGDEKDFQLFNFITRDFFF